MKKSLLNLIIFLIILTVGLGVLQNTLLSPDTITIGKETTKNQEKIEEIKEVSLSKWIELYNNTNYNKVEIEDGTLMKGYIFIGTGEQQGILSLGKSKIVDKYVVISSKKPLDSSITELGISLTGATSITTIYNETSRFMRLIEQFGVMLLILIVFIIAAKFMLGKGNGAGGLMNIQIGKKPTATAKKTKFSDIAGMEEVKNELVEVVDYLKYPEKYAKV